ncbi:pirin family protein [Roseateles paludis]|jgi:redox-sensitive bicupin YhaK (pirin superfamily)|uniref:Pirin family protein n=1 Tax=Roseateles paludis TaxID=3145238 RepID=A0ABV0G1T7_9BURK
MILARAPLGMHWPTLDPFLFCAHHDDHYPKGDGRFGPAASLAGRQMGSDFSGLNGWSMYHGQQVPGFPAHPHRGFETVTLVRTGRIDHSDSLGAAARFGGGDVQWLTAGSGIVHAEMFPLLLEDAENPLELFQIWLNLPARSKMCAPYFSMFWADTIPRGRFGPEGGPGTEVVVVAGQLPGLDGLTPLAPPPDSWASQEGADVGIFTLKLDPGAQFTLPPAAGPQTLRVAYFFAGDALTAAGQAVAEPSALQVEASQPLLLTNPGQQPAELLVLQGRPIGEPVARHGPFVMNTEAEIRTAFADYQRTRFGGWPWDSEGPVHGSDATRFARHPGGAEERRG